MHTIYAYENAFNFTPDDTLATLEETTEALSFASSFGRDHDIHTYQLAALTWNDLSDAQLREIIVWKTDQDGDPLKYRVWAKKWEDKRYFVTMSCGEEKAICVTDNLSSMEGKASFWSIISDTYPLAVFKLMLT